MYNAFNQQNSKKTTKQYAVIQPPHQWVGDGLADMAVPVISLAHMAIYERIAGYSLGHEIILFDTLKKAQGSSGWRGRGQFAVIEFETSDNRVMKFCKIYEISKWEKKMELQDDGKTVENVRKPIWEGRNIINRDLTKGALEEFDKQYKAVTKKSAQRPH